MVSFESSHEWIEKIRLSLGDDSIIHHLVIDEQYRGVDLDQQLTTHLGNSRFDVIVIDGADRVGTARSSLKYLAVGGIVVVNNSDAQFGDRPNELLSVYRDAGMMRTTSTASGPRFSSRRRHQLHSALGRSRSQERRTRHASSPTQIAAR